MRDGRSGPPFESEPGSLIAPPRLGRQIISARSPGAKLAGGSCRPFLATAGFDKDSRLVALAEVRHSEVIFENSCGLAVRMWLIGRRRLFENAM